MAAIGPEGSARPTGRRPVRPNDPGPPARISVSETRLQIRLIEAELASGQLVLPFATALRTDRGYHLCWHAALDGHDGLAQFADWLQTETQASQRRFGFGMA